MSEFRNVDVLSHAMHSCLQLIRSRIRCDPDWNYTTADYLVFVNANWNYMKAIEKSLKLTYQANIKVDPHYFDAAKMFMYSVTGKK